MSSRAEYREFQKQVAGRLAEARSGVSQNRLARELQYSQQMISRYESGRVPKCFLYLARLSERKQIDVNWILAGPGQPATAPRSSDVATSNAGALVAKLESGTGAESAGLGELLGEELTPELYESFEVEVVIALLSLWRQASPPLRSVLANRLRAVTLWWKAHAPELAEPLTAFSKALATEEPTPLAPLTEIAERFRAREDDESLRRGIRLYKFLLSEIEKEGARADLATTLIRLGQMHRKTAQWSKAKEFYTRGLRVAQSVDDPRLLEEAWAGLGNLAEDLTDLVSARSCFRQELEAAFRTGDSRLRIRSYVSLSLIAAESKHNVREGVEYADAGLALCDESGDGEYRSELLVNKGVLLANLARRDEARLAYTEAIRRVAGSKEARLKATAYHNLAELALADGDLPEAETLLDQAEAWCAGAELPAKRCSILLNRARASLRGGRLREAMRASRQALQIAEKHGFETLLAEAQSLNAEVEEGIPARIGAA